MRDPLDCCTRRSSFSHCCSPIRPLQHPIGIGYIGFGPSDVNVNNERDTSSSDSRLDLAENVSTEWGKDISTRNLPEQSHSSCGLTVASSTATRCAVPISSSSFTDPTKVLGLKTSSNVLSARKLWWFFSQIVSDASIPKGIKILIWKNKKAIQKEIEALAQKYFEIFNVGIDLLIQTQMEILKKDGEVQAYNEVKVLTQKQVEVLTLRKIEDLIQKNLEVLLKKNPDEAIRREVHVLIRTKIEALLAEMEVLCRKKTEAFQKEMKILTRKDIEGASTENFKNEDRLGKSQAIVDPKGDVPVTEPLIETTKAPVLRLAVRSRKATTVSSSPGAVCAVTGKRNFMTDDERSSVKLFVKRPRGHMDNVKPSKGHLDVVDSLTVQQSHVAYGCLPSNFQSSKWSSIDKTIFEFLSDTHVCGNHSTTESSSLIPLIETQSVIKTEPSSIDRQSPNSFLKPRKQIQNQPNAGPVPFLPAIQKFNHIIGSYRDFRTQCDIIQRFLDDSHWCVANNTSGSRCHWTMPRVTPERKLKVLRLFNDLLQLNLHTDKQECVDKLVELTSIVVCHNQLGFVKDELKALLQTGQSRCSAQPVSMPLDPQAEGSLSVDRSDVASVSQERDLSQTPTKMMMKKKQKRVGMNFPPPTFEVEYWLRTPTCQGLNYLPKYEPFDVRELYSESLRDYLMDEARAPLYTGETRSVRGFRPPDETKDGYLYVYWNRASFGLIKIGHTTVEVNHRLQRWEDDCQRVADEHYRSPHRIKNVARVERLIHTEFREFRVCTWCKLCRKNHIEWFRGLDLALVKRRMKAWTDWVTKEPYEIRDGVWRLKERPGYELPQTDVTDRVAEESPKKGKESVAKRSPRYHLRGLRTHSDEIPRLNLLERLVLHDSLDSSRPLV